jgi:hypothetical protein
MNLSEFAQYIGDVGKADLALIEKGILNNIMDAHPGERTG